MEDFYSLIDAAKAAMEIGWEVKGKTKEDRGLKAAEVLEDNKSRIFASLLWIGRSLERIADPRRQEWNDQIASWKREWIRRTETGMDFVFGKNRPRIWGILYDIAEEYQFPLNRKDMFEDLDESLRSYTPKSKDRADEWWRANQQRIVAAFSD